MVAETGATAPDAARAFLVARDETAVAVFFFRLDGRLAREFATRVIELVGDVLHAVVGLRNSVEENVLVETMSAPARK